MKKELTKQDLDFYLGEIAYSYHDGYMPTGFPIEFGCVEYWEAIDSVLGDITKRIVKRYGLDEVDK